MAAATATATDGIAVVDVCAADTTKIASTHGHLEISDAAATVDIII